MNYAFKHCGAISSIRSFQLYVYRRFFWFALTALVVLFLRGSQLLFWFFLRRNAPNIHSTLPVGSQTAKLLSELLINTTGNSLPAWHGFVSLGLRNVLCCPDCSISTYYLLFLKRYFGSLGVGDPSGGNKEVHKS